MLRMFCGFDEREAIGFHVFVASCLHKASIPVTFCPLKVNGAQQGSNAFTASRFLVPYLCGYKGKAVFADAADMVCTADLAQLSAQLQGVTGAVAVVQHQYKTRNKVKYIGTEMESPNLDYERKNWASLMLINCEHPAWQAVTPESINTWDILDLLQFKFLADAEIEPAPNEWNRLVDEGQEVMGAKILHWTAGIPAFDHYKDAPAANIWRLEHARTTYPLLTL